MNWPASSLAEEAFLSYVGKPFDYDVFVSYAHAENETGAVMSARFRQLRPEVAIAALVKKVLQAEIARAEREQAEEATA